MFLGEYQTKFSGKNRIILPKKFRNELSGRSKIYLSRGFDGCIFGFSEKDFLKEAEKQLEIPSEDEKGKNLRRYFFSAAEEAEIDLQGRFIIPSKLVEYASLKDEISLIGAGDHFEIWDFKKWKQLIKKLETER